MAAIKFRPLGDRVLVQRQELETKTKGGIYIPDNAAEKPSRGVVLRAGKGKIMENGDVRPMDIKEGDEIYFGKYAGTELKVDGDDFIVMREEDVIGIAE